MSSPLSESDTESSETDAPEGMAETSGSPVQPSSGTTVISADLLPPTSVTWHEVDNPADLRAWCERWHSRPALAIDTEFVRERTFHPQLGLLQVGDGEDIVLIDPLAIDDLSPFAALLDDPSVVKVLHSCSEDLEVFHHALGTLPRPLFDTQIASSFAGLRHSMGYANLVDTLCDIPLPKGQTRSNWLRRPLSAAQLRYAALDVLYLLPIYRYLRERLEAMGRSHWVEEDTDRLLDEGRFEVDELAHYRKMGRGRRMRPRQLAVLKEICVWREREARKRNLPRGFVLKDAAIPALAFRQPKNESGLRRIRELDRKEAQRHGPKLLELVRAGLDIDEAELPAPFPPSIDLQPHKALVAQLREQIRQTAEELEMAPELLASRKTIEALVRRWLGNKEPLLPRALRGWRSEVLGLGLGSVLATHQQESR